MPRECVQSFWLQEYLGRMQRLCIRSFLHHGHPFHLYGYRRPKGLPRGAVFRNAAELLGPEEVFVYRHGYGRGSPAAFSDYFRYKLLLERGGWWADLDVVLLGPLDFPQEHVVGCERSPDGGTHIASALVKAPPGSAIMSYCVGYCRAVDRSRLRWGQIGPQLLAQAVEAVQLCVRKLDPDVFYPINYWQAEQLVDSGRLPEQAVAVHLWHSQWRHRGLDPDRLHDPQCIYEQLIARYGPHHWRPHAARRGSKGSVLAGLFRPFYAAKSSRAE